MATLVLAAVGSFLAGPPGALIGSTIGSTIDRALLFSPGGRTREGPRLSDARIQSSALGATIPLVYGTARVAGNVLWSSGLKETRTETTQKSGGKGGSKTTTVEFSYSTSVVVGLSARPIVRVDRIWADGKLLRDAAGTLLSPVTVRLYTGSETQAPDPLLQGIEGANRTPAMRGLAYIVLEDLELAAFANRLPNLSFEVVADTAPTVGDILGDLAARAGVPAVDASAATDAVGGLALAREVDARGVVEEVLSVFPLVASEGDGTLRFSPLLATAGASALDDDLGTRPDDKPRTPRVTIERGQASELPAEISLSYSDPGRDYQAGVQRARRQLGHAERRESRATALVLDAMTAQQQADRALALAWQHQESHRLALPLSFADLEPGDRLDYVLDGASRRLLIEEITRHPLHLVVRGFPLAGTAGLLPDAGAVGDFPPSTVIDPGTSVLHVLDMPGLAATSASPRILAAMAGASTAWPGAVLYVSRDGGASYDRLAASSAPAVVGTARDVLGVGPATFWDEANSVRIDLLAGDMSLESQSALAVLNGANRAVLGEEIIQFRSATLEADGSYTLSGLLRGRGGTEAAIATHAAGERFVLLDGGAILGLDVPLDLVGQSVLAKAVTVNGLIEDVPAATLSIGGDSLKPLAPVHVRATRAADGSLTLDWVRRTRFGGGWRDGTDVPLNEESERYEVDILSGGNVVRTLGTTSPVAIYDAAEQSADFGAPQATLDIAIYQMSAAVGRGLPWTGTV